jgi:probable phosphoglycerate mutase
MTTIYLVRHGQSTWNEIKRIQGKQDPPLSALGCRQAIALAHALQREALTAIYSSPQKRARMTAEAIAANHKLPVRTVEQLAEIDHGHWEGLTEAEVQQRFAASFHLWITRPSQTQMPGGEHCTAVQQRVLQAWHDLLAHHEEDRILIVSHDIPVKVIIAHVLGLELDQIGQLVIDNAAINIVRAVDGRLQLVQLNDRCHLNGMHDP